MTDLREAARRVLERWDSPAWKWGDGPTADLMENLRAALSEQPAAPQPVAPAVPEKYLRNMLRWLWMLKEAEPGIPYWTNGRFKADVEDAANALAKALAAPPAPAESAEPVARVVGWRPAVKCTPEQNFNAGTPLPADVAYWDAQGCGIEYAYAAPPAVKESLTTAAQPPKRGPLTDEEIFDALPLGIAPYTTLCGSAEILKFARAIERAITGA